VRINYIEICGFRSYGPQPQRIDLTTPITVIHANNSQGKTSLAEAFEFLYTGGTSRRQLGGGSPGEFEGALRNAHLPASAVVYVEAEVQMDDGGTRVLRRQLVNDYEGAADCIGTLTLDGTVIDSVAEVGLPLSDPPLAAPVLLEHGLRYAVSAKPGERSDYFKAVLEVADLDLLRSEIAAVVSEREAQPREPLALRLENLRSHPQIGSHLASSSQWTAASLSAALLSALDALVPPTEDETPPVDALSAAITRVTGELAARQNTLLPIAQLRPSANPRPGRHTRLTAISPTPGETSSAEEPSFAERLESYNSTVGRVDASVAAVLPLFHAVLSIDSLPHSPDDASVDCPVCQTPGALSAERVEAIRRQLADQEDLTGESERLRNALTRLSADLAALGNWVGTTVPAAASWTDEERAAYRATAVELQGEAGPLDASVQLATGLRTSAETAQQHVEASLVAIERVGHAVNRSVLAEQDDFEALKTAEDDLRRAVVAHEALVSQARVDAESVIGEVEPMLAARSSTSGWSELAELARDRESLLAALDRQHAKDVATRRLRSAQRKVTTAAKEVVDQRLEVMADETRRWWSLMRPDELTTFDRLARRGAGNRYLDLTASLVPEIAASGVVRNALAVLSNSQLNALGLATFLARCRLLGSTVVFLDDPVPGSDREHRYTFADKVASELLMSGLQIVVATHDAELARTLQTLHQHVGTGEYSATLVDPRQGTAVLRTGDDFEHLMLNAQGQMSSPLPENRRSAGNSLRIATERLAKHILVAGRQAADDAQASLADYDGKNLRDLRPQVIEYCKAPNEPGQWQTLARILNDSDHDADPPQPADLKTCYDMLREIKRRHGVRTSSSITGQAA